ncbi:tetratricopeptide repeat protein 6 [Discoglossus pictus]
MADRRGHLHFRVNYAEEFKIKKELERLLKRPHRDFRHVSVDPHLGNSLPLLPMQEAPIPYIDRFDSTASPTYNGIRTFFQTAYQSVPQDVKDLDLKKEPSLKLRPLVSSAKSSFREVIQDATDQKCLQNDHSYLPPKNIGHQNKELKKPAIAPMAGTTKAISVLPRPEPPSKIKSYTSHLAPKPGITLKPLVADKKEKKIPKVTRVSSAKCKKTVSTKLHSISEDDSSATTSDSDSEDSEDSQITLRKKRKKRTSKMVKNIQENIISSQNITSKVPLKDKLYEVADKPVILSQGGQYNSSPKTTTEELPAALKTTSKATARSVDEIIASLQTPQIPSASDLMIKELMESIMGENYRATFGEVLEEKYETQIEEKEQPMVKNTELQLQDLIPDMVAMQTEQMLDVASSLLSEEEDLELSTDMSISIQMEQETSFHDEAMTEEEAKRVLNTSSKVSFSDIIHVKGDAAPLTRRETAKIHPPAALLATWEPRNKENGQQTIHHLCTTSPSHVLPSYLQLASRVLHTEDRRGHQTCIEMKNLSNMVSEESSTYDDLKEKSRVLEKGLQVSNIPVEDQRGSVINLPPHSARSLEDWKKIAEYYVEGPRVEVVGEQAKLNSKTLRMFWAPAPPKFSVPLSLMQRSVFTKYESSLEDQEAVDQLSANQQESESSEDDQTDPEDQATLNRILFRRHKSLPCISSLSSTPITKSPLVFIQIPRSASAQELSHLQDSSFHLSADFQTSMKELEIWKKQILSSTAPTSSPQLLPDQSDNEVTGPLLTHPEMSEAARLTTEKHTDFDSSDPVVPPKAKINYVASRTKIKRKNRKKLLDPMKVQMIIEEMKKPTRKLERSVSLVKLSVQARSHSATWHSTRRPSLPEQLDFSYFVKNHGGIPADQVVREWVRDIWNDWFDEVFPPSLASAEEPDQYIDIANTCHSDQDAKKEVALFAAVVSVPPVLVEDPMAPVDDVKGEIEHLTHLIDEAERPSGFHLCRRGALNRKLGNLSLALQDLNTAIELQPDLVDAYWHKHLIYLLQGKTSEALDDLNIIIKLNKTYADAYLSKAEIFKGKKDFTMAILSYSQALKCRPSDDDIYFRRAQMYEARDEIVIAMDDYAQCFRLNPRRTDALLKHGLYYFENNNWNASIQDLSALIIQDFSNVQARLYRGRAYTSLARYTEAAEDFSAAIHLDPSNWLAFYYRGCLLRRCHPQRALQDFSVSVLLYDDFENLNCFLYRGLLYTELGLWAEAVFDFERVLALDSTVVLAHMNLGLIALLHQNQHLQAIRHFSAALRVDPVNIKAYLCRAEAYHQGNNLGKALKDLTRAIHLHPYDSQACIMRGKYLLEMKRYDAASFCIHQLSEMTQGASLVQLAVVQAFHQEYNKAIESLLSAIKSKTSPALLISLGKTQMKAKKNKDAAGNFQKALKLLKSATHDMTYTSVKAEIYYLLGLSYMEQLDFLQAFEALSSAIKISSDYCDAYYQRGLCRVRLQQSKCVEDFNRALEINPEHFQAYMCRAAYYGFRKRYTKAIMNCNAAIRVQPRSVRAYLYRGALKYQIKAYKLALQDLTKAAKLDQSCSLVYYNRGVCYHQIKMYNEALIDYSIVILLGGWKEVETKVLMNRGLLYLELQDYASALQDFKALALKTPGDMQIHQVIGNCYHRLQQFEEAVQSFSKVIQLDFRSPTGYIGRANAYMEYGHKDGTKLAQRDLLRALHLKPRCIAARICLGYNLQAHGHYQRAWNQFTVALDIDARSVLAFEGRAMVSLQMGDTFAALQDMNAALKINVTAQLLTNRGVIHQFMGKLPNAMKDFQAAITANPKYSLAYFNAANLYFHNRQFSQAIEYYSQSVDLDPCNESAVLNRGITKMLLRDSQGALEDFQMVINLCPVSSAAYFNRATLHNTLQQYQQAERDITQALIIQPEDPLMYKLRADVRGKLGLQKEAIEDYERAITLLQQGPSS